MADLHVVSALKAKRAEIAGRIEHAQGTLRQLVIDLDHVDATLRLYVPDIDLETIKPHPMPPRHSAFRGELTRIIFDAMRAAPGPVTSHDLARTVMAGRGLSPDDLGMFRVMVKRVGAAMRNHRVRGLVTGERIDGTMFAWRLTAK